MIRRFFNSFFGSSSLNSRQQSNLQAEIYRAMLRREAEMGGKLFGPIPEGHRREFFCLDSRTWVWHEEWRDEHGKHHAKTTRYDVRPTGILKAQDGLTYQQISQTEAENLQQAISLYKSQIIDTLYKNDDRFPGRLAA